MMNSITLKKMEQGEEERDLIINRDMVQSIRER
jgi:hypothetical protein